MKNRLDAPSTDDIAQVRQSVRGDAVFQITPFGEKVVMEYGKVYGHQGSGVRQSMPRRVMPRKRPREQQSVAPVQTDNDEELGEELGALDKIAAGSASKRFTSAHQDLQKRLAQYAKQRQLLTEIDAEEPGHATRVKKLQQLQREAQQHLEKSRSLTTHVLDGTKHGLPLGTLACCLSKDAMADLEALGAETWHFDGNYAHLFKCLQAALGAPFVLWVCPSHEDEEKLVFGDDASLFAGCAKLIGGGVAGPAWLKASMVANKLLPPTLCLERGLAQHLRLHLHNSLGKCSSFAARAVALAIEAAAAVPSSSQWHIHKKWKEVSGPQPARSEPKRFQTPSLKCQVSCRPTTLCFLHLVLLIFCPPWVPRDKKNTHVLLSEAKLAEKKGQIPKHMGRMTTARSFLSHCRALTLFVWALALVWQAT